MDYETRKLTISSAHNTVQQNSIFLMQIIESIDQPFLIIDPDTYTVEISNRAARELLNIIPGQPCYSQIYSFITPCRENGLECPIDEIRRTRKSATVNHHSVGENYSRKVRQVRGYPLFDTKGQLSKVIHYYQDITRKEEDGINKHLLDTAITFSDDSIVITDARGIIQYVNPAFEKITGFDNSEVVNKNASILKSGKQDAIFYEKMWFILSKGHNWHGKLVNKKKDGSLFEEEVSISPVKDSNGHIVNYLAIKRDITGRKRLESIAEASNLMENLGYVFSGIRHEIGNPLNSIKMTLSVLQKNIDSFPREQVTEFIQRSLTETTRIEYLLRALKNFSLFEKPKMKMDRIDEFLNNFVSLIRQDFNEKGVRIKTDFSKDVKWGYTDVRALHQVMLNLMTNSMDSLVDRPLKQIKITTRKVFRLIKITVEDTGRGMTQDEKENLFKPFFTSKSDGTGLGLVIVKKMLSQMHGIIKIKTQKGVGTRVMILIPEGEIKME